MQQEKPPRKGMLYVVATPIGNLEDITLRAIRILREVGLIAAEDTRRAKKLLTAHQIPTPVTSLYDQNERRKTPSIIAKICEGTDVAYISDAGTPGISDPGYVLINQAIECDIRVVPIPGVSAVVAALSASGLPMDRFLFHGFLPHRESARRKVFEDLGQEPATLIFYESPNRLQAALSDAEQAFGSRKIVVARELTKIHEEIVRGPARDVAQKLGAGAIKGEVTLMVSGCRESRELPSDEDIRLRINELGKESALSNRDVIEKVAAEMDVPKHRVYRLAVRQPR